MGSTLSPSPLRVLIAEAHPIVVLGLPDLLKTLGYMLVGSVASGQEAILAAGEHQPDLMLVAAVARSIQKQKAAPKSGQSAGRKRLMRDDTTLHRDG